MRAGVAMLLLAVMVIGCVAGALSQYGVAMTGNAKCGMEEHQHTAECYTSVLTCGREEDPGHIHSDECLYQEELVCGLEEGEDHVHTEACRVTPEGYACGEEEREAHFHDDSCYTTELACGKEEHIHTDVCYMDANADVETEEVWAKQYAGIQWKGIWGEDLAMAAAMQLGYKESIENFTVAEDGSRKGYTRYGAFAGDPYGNWDAAFVSFCLHYAGIQSKDAETPAFPKVADSAKWCEEFGKMSEGNSAFLTGPEGYVPAAGDLIFSQRENEETAVQMGIVASFDQEKNEIHVIEGNSQNEVKENIYPLGEAHIVRFLKLTELEAACKAAAEAPAEEAPADQAEDGERGPIFTTEDPAGPEDPVGTEAPADPEDPAETEIPEEPTVELTTVVDGTTITLSGPQSSFEEGKEYSIQASKVEDEQVIATIEEAIAPLEDPNAAPIATAEKAEPAAPAENPTAVPEETSASEQAAAAAPEEVAAAPEQIPEAAPEEATADSEAAPEESAAPAAEEQTASPEEPAAQSGDPAEKPAAAAEEPAQQVKQIKSYQAFDIKLMANNEEVQPLGSVSVKFSSPEVAESVEDEKAEVKVIHVDEITGAATDMEAVATEEKDVVIETGHFSVYVYVEVGVAAIEGVSINIQHWGEDITTINSEYYGKNKGTGTGATEYPEEGFDTDEKQTDATKKNGHVVTKTGTYQIYSTDLDFKLPSETYRSLQSLSKVYSIDQGQRYEITKVWVSKPGKEANCGNAATWGTKDVDYTEYTSEELTNAALKEITDLQEGSVIRFWYKPKTGNTVKEPVTFYDYDFSTGVKSDDVLYTEEKGANARSNFKNNGKPKLGVGQWSSGNASSWAEAKDDNKYDGKNLNAGNGGIQPAKGLVKNELSGGADGQLAFVDGIDASQSLFSHDPDGGSRQHNNYQLEFQQDGDTYTLINVWNGKNLTNAKNLTSFKSRSSWGDKNYIFSNEFWPLDDVPAAQRKDPLLGGATVYKAVSDSGATRTLLGVHKNGVANDWPSTAHNWYFGMTYTVKFTIGDYTGPLEYYFRGDDDFWLFVDGKLAVDLGGIHTATGKTYNLDYLKNEDKDKEHVLKVYYMERGATGSCCYMQFTLPKAKIEALPEPETTSYTVEKKWDDNENGFRPQDIEISLYKIKEGENGEKIETKARTITLPLKDEEGYYIDQSGQRVDNPVWTYTWKDLPITDGKTGKRITYDAKEEFIDETNESNPMLGYDYDKEVSSDGTNATITLTNWIKDKKVKVYKKWEDDGEELGNRPGEVTFVLYANGEEYKDHTGNRRTVTVSKGTGWAGEFDHVPEYYYKEDATTGKGTWEKVEYTVVEEPALNGNEFVGANGAIYKIELVEVTSDEDRAKDYIAVFKATNTLVTKNVCIEKVSQSKPANHLKGAEFKLYAYSEDLFNAEGKLNPNAEPKGTYITGENGRIDIQGLRFGKYYLIETKAPEGYALLEKPIELVVTKEGVTVNFQIDGWDDASHVELKDEDNESKYVIQIPNELFYTLPSTGGLGIYWSILCGVLLMAVASLIVYRNKCKEVL